MNSGFSLFEASILVAVYRGVNTLDSLKELFNSVDPRVIEATLLKLESMGLLRRERRGFIRKKTVYVLTQSGVEKLEEALSILRDASEKAKAKIESAEARGRIEDYAPILGAELFGILPLLLMLGFLPPLMFEGYEELVPEGYEEGEELDFGDSFDIDMGE